MKLDNLNLSFDLDKLRAIDSPTVKTSSDRNLDSPFIIDINGNSYFYSEPESRDYDALKTAIALGVGCVEMSP